MGGKTEEPVLVTGWHLAPELVPQSLSGGRVSVGLVMAWDQRGGLLAGAGDLRVVRLWDCTSETKLADLPTASESFVTCLDLGWEGSKSDGFPRASSVSSLLSPATLFKASHWLH